MISYLGFHAEVEYNASLCIYLREINIISCISIQEIIGLIIPQQDCEDSEGMPAIEIRPRNMDEDSGRLTENLFSSNDIHEIIY